MSKINVGVGDDFPMNEASGPETYTCGRRRAHWAAHREARRARYFALKEARLARWAAWCAYWHGANGDAKPKPQEGDASYTDVPPFKDGKA